MTLAELAFARFPEALVSAGYHSGCCEDEKQLAEWVREALGRDRLPSGYRKVISEVFGKCRNREKLKRGGPKVEPTVLLMTAQEVLERMKWYKPTRPDLFVSEGKRMEDLMSFELEPLRYMSFACPTWPRRRTRKVDVGECLRYWKKWARKRGRPYVGVEIGGAVWGFYRYSVCSEALVSVCFPSGVSFSSVDLLDARGLTESRAVRLLWGGEAVRRWRYGKEREEIERGMAELYAPLENAVRLAWYVYSGSCNIRLEGEKNA